MEKYNKKKVIIYKTYQMYRKDSLYKLNRDLLRSHNYHLGNKNSETALIIIKINYIIYYLTLLIKHIKIIIKELLVV